MRVLSRFWRRSHENFAGQFIPASRRIRARVVWSIHWREAGAGGRWPDLSCGRWKRGTGKRRTKFPGWKTHDHRQLNAKWISLKLKGILLRKWIRHWRHFLGGKVTKRKQLLLYRNTLCIRWEMTRLTRRCGCDLCSAELVVHHSIRMPCPWRDAAIWSRDAAADAAAAADDDDDDDDEWLCRGHAVPSFSRT